MALLGVYSQTAQSAEPPVPSQMGGSPTEGVTHGGTSHAPRHVGSLRRHPPTPLLGTPFATSVHPNTPAGTTSLVAGYEILGELGPRRHGRRLQGPAVGLNRARRPEDDPGRRARRRGASWPASAPRPRPSPACSTPTSSRSTRSASTTAGRTSPWSSSTAAASTGSWHGDAAAARARPPRWSRRWPGPSTTPTSTASSTAT